MKIKLKIAILLFAISSCEYIVCETPKSKVVYIGPCSVSEYSECRVVLENGKRVTVGAPIMVGDIIEYNSFSNRWVLKDPSPLKRNNP